MKTTQRMRVADALLSQIQDGRYGLGDKLPSERNLAEEFGVSRTIVREALGTLTTMEIVESQLGRGSFVISTDNAAGEEPLDVDQLIDVVQVREILEAGALRMAAARDDPGARKRVQRCLDALDAQVARGLDTQDLDAELHRSFIEAASSPMLLRVWDQMSSAIKQSIYLSPRGKTMGESLLCQHVAIARGITEGELEEALAASAAMHAEHRQLLRRLRES
jgi:GntR family transcriptional repressor for pyruvate dehydrogenase complex